MVKFYRQVKKKTIRGLLLVGCFIALAAIRAIAVPLAGNYTIDKNSAATATNFQSFQALFTELATNGVSGGVTVNVLNGPYTEQVKANAIAGVNSINTVTIIGNANHLIYNYLGSVPADAYTLQFNGADFVIIKNLIIEAQGTGVAWGVHFTNNSDNNRLEDCTIKMYSTTFSQNSSAGIVVAASLTNITTAGAAAANLALHGCVVSGTAKGSPWHGIYLNPQSSGAIASNITVRNCNVQSFRESAIYMTNCRGVKISKNIISRPILENVTHSNGIVAINTNREDIIEENRIFDCFKSVLSSSLFVTFTAINIQNGNDVDVVNNAIYENNNLSTWYGIYFKCSPGIKIIHNTISNDNALSTSADIYGLYHDNSCASSGAEFKNNIVSLKRGGTATRFAIYQDGQAITTNNNDLFVAGSNAYIGYAGGQKWATLVDWQSVSSAPGAPFDQNSVSEDPKYSNLVSGNLTPENIMLDGVGSPSAVAFDINGTPRDVNTPDPGALEFNIDANVSKIIMNGPTGCQGQQDTVKVWILNKSTVDLSGFDVSYTVNSGTSVEQDFKGVLKASDSVLFVFDSPVQFTNPGAYTVTTRVGLKPSIGPYAISIAASPIGGMLVQGKPFKGRFAAGTIAEPDIVASPDSLIYELAMPSAFPNSLYGNTWAIKRIFLDVQGGGSMGNTDTAWVAPAFGTNGMLRFKAPIGFTGKNIELGVVPVSLINNCEAPAVWREIYVTPRPKAIFTQTDVCDQSPMLFSNASAINKGTLRYLWKFGDGDTSNATNPAKTYQAAGTYTVTLIAISDQGYADSVTKQVTVLENPVPDFLYGNRCQGTALTFSNASTVPGGSPLYSWVFGDGIGGSTAENPSYTYITPNVYFVSLTIVDAKGCRASVSKPVTFSQKPVADFSFPGITCNQKKVQFTNNSTPAGLTGYVWQFGDNTSANGKHVDHLYGAAGQYDVVLIARNQFDCVDSIVKTVTLIESPLAEFVLSTQCAQTPVQFINTTNEPKNDTVVYSWEIMPDNVAETHKNFTYTFGSIGVKEISLTAAAGNGCTTHITKKLYFAQKPIANFSMRQSACASDVITLSNGSVINNDTLWYNWFFGNGDTSTAEDPDVVFKNAGTYLVKLLASSGIGCSDSLEKSINIFPVPNSDFLIQSAGYGDGSMILTPVIQNGGGTYHWQYGDGQSSDTAQQHLIKYSSTGKVEIILRIANNGCVSVTKKSVNINPLSTGKIDGDGTQGITLFPSPASHQLSVTSNNTIHRIEVFNTLGQSVYSAANNNAGGQVTFSVQSLSQGVYYLTVYSNKGNSTVKFVVSR